METKKLLKELNEHNISDLFLVIERCQKLIKYELVGRGVLS